MLGDSFLDQNEILLQGNEDEGPLLNGITDVAAAVRVDGRGVQPEGVELCDMMLVS